MTSPHKILRKSYKIIQLNQPHPDPPQGEGAKSMIILGLHPPLGEGRGGVGLINWFYCTYDVFIIDLSLGTQWRMTLYSIVFFKILRISFLRVIFCNSFIFVSKSGVLYFRQNSHKILYIHIHFQRTICYLRWTPLSELSPSFLNNLKLNHHQIHFPINICSFHIFCVIL